MNVDSFLISEFAGTDAAQSLTVYRTFNQVVTSALPIGLPTLYLSMILHAHPDEAGEARDRDSSAWIETGSNPRDQQRPRSCGRGAGYSWDAAQAHCRRRAGEFPVRA